MTDIETVLSTPTAGDAPKVLPTEDDVTEAMKDVVDPELGINVVDLGLLYGNQVHDDRTVTLDMTLTSAACPLTDVIEDQTRAALAPLVDDVRINWVWMPLQRLRDGVGRSAPAAYGVRGSGGRLAGVSPHRITPSCRVRSWSPRSNRRSARGALVVGARDVPATTPP